jgi:hypothetical protein
LSCALIAFERCSGAKALTLGQRHVETRSQTELILVETRPDLQRPLSHHLRFDRLSRGPVHLIHRHEEVSGQPRIVISELFEKLFQRLDLDRPSVRAHHRQRDLLDEHLGETADVVGESIELNRSVVVLHAAPHIAIPIRRKAAR